APKKTAPKKTAPKKTAPKKTAPKKVVAAPKKAATKKAATKKAATKKAATKKAAPKKTAPKKVVAAPTGLSSQETVLPTLAPAGLVAGARPVPGAAQPAATAGGPAPGTYVVRSGEKPWTAAELSSVRADLEEEAVRLRKELEVAESDIAELIRDSADTAGDDQADAGSKAFEREHEMSLANNTRDLLAQGERAMQRIDDGTYGSCESCGNPIGKERLRFFPRATLCVACKQREERR
ncbi:MAG: TraR/DksA family transcriptional regulator, partial [Actinomycetota bacterium]|nr:TraR/DksA family transcriptional regulator [Actinomycetota bacterium]